MSWLRKFILSLLVGAVTCSPAVSEPSHGLAIYLDFETAPPPRVLSALESEVERLLSPPPATLVWHLLRDNDGQNSANHLAVIRFDGRCDAHTQSPPPESDSRLILGSTMVTGGRVQPFMRVECDQVRDFIAVHPSGSVIANVEEQSYGRALGQVIAHELYHILLGTGHHSLSGLSKAFHSPRELGRLTNHFEPAVRSRLLAALSGQEALLPARQ
jgi:hypothetical protein